MWIPAMEFILITLLIQLAAAILNLILKLQAVFI